MVKQTNICTQGECQGECYRCRLAAVAADRDRWQRLAKDLFDRHMVKGTFGPWADDWNPEYEQAFWGE